MILLLAATLYPTAWANDYCVYRQLDKTHEQAVELANKAKGERTPEAWQRIKLNTTCNENPEMVEELRNSP